MRLLILGTGGMAHQHARAFAAIEGVELVAAVDTRDAVRRAFCDDHAIPRDFATLAEAIAWGQFDAATNVTPDAAHCETTLALLAAGKHVLCEKPLATNAGDTARMWDAARRAGVVHMVNLTYRNVPAVQAAAAMVRAGAIGDLRHLEASYLQSWLTQPAWGDWRTEPQWLWRLSTAHGSKGVLGDVGIHILDFATYIAGEDVAELSCRLAVFDKAEGGRIGEYLLDANDSAVMQVALAGGALGTVTATRFASGHLNDLRLRIYGTKGGLEVGFEGAVSRLRGCLGDDLREARWSDIECADVPTIYEQFVSNIKTGGSDGPDFGRGHALQRLLDTAEWSDREGGQPKVIEE